MPVKIQLDKHFRESWDARLVARIILTGRRILFWLARNVWQLAGAGVGLWMGWLMLSWWLRGTMP